MAVALISLALWLGNARDSTEAGSAATAAVFTFLAAGMLARLFVGRAWEKRGRALKGRGWGLATGAGVILTLAGAVFGAAQPYDHMGQTNGDLSMSLAPPRGGTSPDGTNWYVAMDPTAESEDGQTWVEYEATTDSNTMQQLPAHQSFDVALTLPDGTTLDCTTTSDQTADVDRDAECPEFVPWWQLNESTISIAPSS